MPTSRRKGSSPCRSVVLALSALLVLLWALFASGPVGSAPAAAETGQKALILESSVTNGAASFEATNAVGNGFTVDLVSDPAWAAMTAAQFADYQLIIVGDPTCAPLPQVVSQNAAALADAVMARAGSNTKLGNRILIGTDPVFHYFQGGTKLIEAGIDFAGVQDGATGLYLDFSCHDGDWDLNGVPDAQDKLLPLLTIDPSGAWTQNNSPPCGAAASLISNAAQFSALTSTDLQGWFCSVHETFPTFPTDWAPLAVATDTPTRPTCGTDVDTGAAVCGEAYLLIAGSGIVVESPNLSLDPATASNPVGTQHAVTATVTNPDGSPRGGVVVSFVVTGANAGASGICAPASCATDALGKVVFTYTGANAGDDTINAAMTIDGSRQSATASKTWTAAPPSKTTSTTYTGGASVQYSDAVVLSGTLLDTSVSPTVGIAGKQVDFTLGAQSASASPTDASGNVSTALVVTQKPGSVATVATSFAGDSTYAASSDSDPFAIAKEDCTLTYSGDTLVAPATATVLAADLGEPDSSVGDRANKTVVFTVTGVSTPMQAFLTVTDGNGHASLTANLGPDVYGVSVAFGGDDYYQACEALTETLVTVQAASAKVTGGGWVSIGTGRTSFGFNAIPIAGGWKGQFQLRSNSGKNRFHGGVVTTLTSAGNTATWSGTGRWNGQSGYTYTITVIDNGSSGSKKLDMVSITIKNTSNATVYTTGGAQTLKGGNITVH